MDGSRWISGRWMMTGSLALLVWGGPMQAEEYIPPERMENDPQVQLWRKRQQAESEARQKQLQDEAETSRRTGERLQQTLREEEEARQRVLEEKARLDRQKEEVFRGWLERLAAAIGEGRKEDAARYYREAVAVLPTDKRLAGLQERIAKMREPEPPSPPPSPSPDPSPWPDPKRFEPASTTGNAFGKGTEWGWKSLPEGGRLPLIPAIEEEARKAKAAKSGTPPPCWDKPGKQANECIDSRTGMEFVWVPGGTFRMGAPEDRSGPEVALKGFWLGKYEVTQGQWQGVMGNNPSGFKKGAGFPVESVSWNEIQGFLDKLNGSGKRQFELPTEAQWEYAARDGGRDILYPWGDEDPVCRKGVRNGAKFDDNKDCDDTGTEPVGSYAASPNLGLYDMAGNVWEWTCSRWESPYDMEYKKCADWEIFSSNRVYRGGSWRNSPAGVRSAYRSRYDPDDRFDNLGFRLSRTGP
ncbi:MAG: SUMF1/EgtB/PvdO family nonheme iron enzyme [Magnetococcales bacterium]|nr:SUMF1/EgtB/PvdO family nonheme iron enzyme [Magnetococcales bacterium]